MKTQTIIRLAFFSWTGAVILAPWALANAPQDEAQPGDTYQLRAWALYDNGEAEARTADHRLIGFACGADRLTMTAREEDQFPVEGCEAIEAIEAVCAPDPAYPDEPVMAWECARYMGDGW